MLEALAVAAIVMSALAMIAVVFAFVRLSGRIDANLGNIGNNKAAIGDNKKLLDEYARIVRDMAASIEDIKIELATAKAMMFAYEAKLKGEQGKWCLEYEGNKKWYEPGVLLRTESASGQNTTEFSYDKSTGNVSATSKSKNKLISSITFSKFGVPLFGKVFSRGVVSKEVSYDELGQVKK